jgi:tetrahydromethanopterin S-methyltransferase subunit G
MENQFLLGIFIGIIVFVVGNLLLVGIKGENKKVNNNTFVACVDALNKRLDIIEQRIARLEELLLKGK